MDTDELLGNLTPLQREIIRDLRLNGDNVPANIADNIGSHPNSVSRALSGKNYKHGSLDDLSLTKNKGRGVWTLTDGGGAVADELL